MNKKNIRKNFFQLFLLLIIILLLGLGVALGLQKSNVFWSSSSQVSTQSSLLKVVWADEAKTQLKISWQENIDTDIAYYKLYHGTQSGNYSDSYQIESSKNSAIIDVGNYSNDRHYFALSALDNSNNESHRSLELIVNLDPEEAGCGNGIVEETENLNEVCDSNIKNCTTNAGYRGYQICLDNCTGWDSTCNALESCGDGIINGEEGCEGEDTNILCHDGLYQGIRACNNCQLGDCVIGSKTCGNGILEGAEQCMDNDIYAQNCLFENKYIGTQECQDCVWGGCVKDPKPGDGYKDPNEECDGNDGIALNPEESAIDKQYACNSNQEYTGGYCGDGICGPDNDTYTADDIESCDNCLKDCDYDDGDGDGFSRCEDNAPGVYNPSQSDVDGDGIGDVADVCYNYNNQCVTLTVVQGSWTAKFYPFVTNHSGSDFYCYDGDCLGCEDDDPNTLCNTHYASSNVVKYSITKDKRSNVFAHLDSSTNILSLAFIHDEVNDGSGGRIDFGFSGQDWYDLAEVVVADDNSNEFSKSGGDWAWAPCCTDGGMVEMARLDTAWSITVSPSNISGISQWMLKNPGDVEIGEYIPDINQPITIIYNPNN